MAHTIPTPQPYPKNWTVQVPPGSRLDGNYPSETRPPPVTGAGFTLSDGYESGAVNEVINPALGFSPVYSDDYARTGTQSAKITFQQDSLGTDTYLNKTFPEQIVEGSDLWIRAYVYFPATFSFSAAPYSKFLRSKNGAGHSGLVFDSSGTLVATNEIDVGLFIANNPNYKNCGTFVKGSWQHVEYHIKHSSTAGQGIFRVWLNGLLTFNDTQTPTIVSGYSVPGFFYASYWNGGAPQTQSFYVDDLIWTNQTPAGLDAGNNPFVGP